MGCADSKEDHSIPAAYSPKKSNPHQSSRKSLSLPPLSARVKMICQICNQKFSLNSRCPMILCSNKHNACKKCVDFLSQRQITACPFCHIQVLSTFQKNQTILQLLEQSETKGTQKQEEPKDKRKKQTTNSLKQFSPLPIQQNSHKNNRSKTVKMQSLGTEIPEYLKQTLENAKKHNYQKVVHRITTNHKKNVSIVKQIKQDAQILTAIIDLSVFTNLQTLNIGETTQNTECEMYKDQNKNSSDKCIVMTKNGQKGFGFLPRLRILNLSGRHIHYIPSLGQFPNLTTLNLSWNGLSKIQNIGQFKNLQKLHLYNNCIKKIQNLEQLTQLQQLQLQHNQIYKIQNLQKLLHLKQLNLSFNKINKIRNIDHLTELELLHLNSNNIHLIENLRGLTKLTTLTIDNNPIDVKTSQEQIAALKETLGIDLWSKYGWPPISKKNIN